MTNTPTLYRVVDDNERKPKEDGVYICIVDFKAIVHCDDVRFEKGKWREYANPEIEYEHDVLEWLEPIESVREEEIGEFAVRLLEWVKTHCDTVLNNDGEFVWEPDTDNKTCSSKELLEQFKQQLLK